MKSIQWLAVYSITKTSISAGAGTLERSFTTIFRLAAAPPFHIEQLWDMLSGVGSSR